MEKRNIYEEFREEKQHLQIDSKNQKKVQKKLGSLEENTYICPVKLTY